MAPLPLDHFRFLAPFYDRIFGGVDPRRLRELLAPFPAEEGLLLDLGGGTGRVVQALGCRPERVVVVDVSEGMLARARAKGFPCVRAAAEALPFPPGTYGRIVVVDAFHHLANQAQALREMWGASWPPEDGRSLKSRTSATWPCGGSPWGSGSS